MNELCSFVMKTIIYAVLALFVGILLAEMAPVVTFLTENGLPALTQKIYTVPAFFILVLLALKGLFDISQYTDEFIPVKLGIIALVFSIIGLFVFFRILILGVLILIVAAFWSRGIVNSYYPPKEESM